MQFHKTFVKIKDNSDYIDRIKKDYPQDSHRFWLGKKTSITKIHMFFHKQSPWFNQGWTLFDYYFKPGKQPGRAEFNCWAKIGIVFFMGYQFGYFVETENIWEGNWRERLGKI